MYTRSSGISYVSLRTCSAPSISSFLAFLVSPDGPKIVTTGMATSPLSVGVSLSLSRCGRTLSGRPQTDPAPHCREVTAALELAPVHDVREASLGEAPNGLDDIVREDRHT